MFTFGWSEIFLIGIIVVVVIGPKDLPKFIKQVGSFTKYIKKMSSEFKSSINEIAEEEEIKDGINIKKNFENEIKEVQETVKMTENEFSKKN